MRACLLLTLLFSALLSACAGNTRRGEDESSTRREVEIATAAWVAAFNSRDAGRIGAQYAQDAVFWGTGSKTIRTDPAAVADYFKDVGKTPDGRVALDEQHIRIYGNVALNTGYYTFSGARDGKPTSTPARFSMVFHQRGGKWILVDHHSSRIP